MKRHFLLAPVFTDKMIFQANKPIRIFGKCKKGIELNIEFLTQKQKIKTKSDNFLFELNPETYQDKNFLFRIYTKKQEETIYNCQIGEVFLVTGGENVTIPLDETFYIDQGLVDADIRFFELDEDFADDYEYETDNDWKQFGKNDMRGQSIYAYSFARALYDNAKVPLGIITCRFSQSSILSWMNKSDIDMNKEITRYLATKSEEEKNALRPSFVYDNCIKLLAPLSIAGVVFYQGETDFELHNMYERAFKQIVKSYRIQFKNHLMPFIVTQIAGYSYPGVDGIKISSLRVAQSELMDDSNKTYVVSAVDLGEEDDIAPKNKVILTRRLAAVVLEKVLKRGKNSLSPTYFSYQKQGDVLVINTHNNYLHLISRSKKVPGFTFSEDGINFHVVKDVELRGTQIVIRGLNNAKVLCYLCYKFPLCDIYTSNELPLLPFIIKLG